MEGRSLVIEAASVEAIGGGDAAAERPAQRPPRAGALAPAARVRMFSENAAHDTPVFRRDDTRPGDTIDGPAIIAEANATTVVEPGWQARVTELDHLVLARIRPRPKRQAIGTDVDPVMLEVFNNLFMSIAEQMGVRLQNTAYSVNIKERLDFSCALFDADGNLIANAPHMPVHLGSMSESIKTVIRENAGRMQAGDAYVINDPYHGGTHLPDVTVITPVFDRDGREILFYVGSRGHHADIGGSTPGSMPPFSKSLDEEGVRFINFKLVEGQGAGRPGRLREAELMQLLTSGTYPARNPAQNLADLRAQIAANEKGREELLKMVEQFTLEVVRAYMKHVQDNAEESVRRVVTRLKDGAFEYRLDNGAVIKVRITVHHARRGGDDRLHRHLAAAAEQLQRAERRVRRGGALRVPHAGRRRHPAERRLPEAARDHHPGRLDAEPALPVGGGRGQRRDLVLHHERAVRRARRDGVLAGHDEQLHVRQCAAPVLRDHLRAAPARASRASAPSADVRGFDGTDVVQTHMTNSRLTDPEVLEFRYPVRLESYEIRAGSGGAGRWHGGNGGTRRVRFLEAMTASILANNRSIAPFGMAGGQPGEAGRNWVERTDGRVEEMGHIGSVEMNPGDVYVIQTPGGGGYGAG